MTASDRVYMYSNEPQVPIRHMSRAYLSFLVAKDLHCGCQDGLQLEIRDQSVFIE